MVSCCFSANSTDLAIQLKEAFLQLSFQKVRSDQCPQVYKANLIYIIHVFIHRQKKIDVNIMSKEVSVWVEIKLWISD